LSGEAAAGAVVPPIDVWVTPELGRDWPADGLGPVAALTAMLPAPETVEPGSWVGVVPGASPGGGLLARWLRRPASAHVATRCTALLARGYEHVGAGLDDQGRDVAFGQAPR
jgi:hypothetical protein